MFETLITKHSPLFWRSFRIIKDALNHLDEYYPICFGVESFFKLSFILFMIFLIIVLSECKKMNWVYRKCRQNWIYKDKCIVLDDCAYTFRLSVSISVKCEGWSRVSVWDAPRANCLCIHGGVCVRVCMFMCGCTYFSTWVHGHSEARLPAKDKGYW